MATILPTNPEEYLANTIFLKRTGVFISSQGSNGEVRGERGIMKVFGREFPTIERTSTMRVPAKIIQFKMEEHSRLGKIFNLQKDGLFGHEKKNEDNKYGYIYVHAANYPHQLSGCVAPGRSILTTGVNDSRKAMEDIITLLGGFDPSKTFYLNVLN
jgi:hypothetical protein